MCGKAGLWNIVDKNRPSIDVGLLKSGNDRAGQIGIGEDGGKPYVHAIVGEVDGNIEAGAAMADSEGRHDGLWRRVHLQRGSIYPNVLSR